MVSKDSLIFQYSIVKILTTPDTAALLQIIEGSPSTINESAKLNCMLYTMLYNGVVPMNRTFVQAFITTCATITRHGGM